MKYKNVFWLVAVMYLLVIFSGCKKVKLYERLQNIQKAQWSDAQVAAFDFNITDTAALYNVYVVIRHTNQYPYRNLWLNVGLQQAGDTLRHQKFEIQLAGPDQWLGSGMDDIYEHRALMFNEPVHFNKAGNIKFTLEQVMRQNPLPGIMQAGVRIEPVNRQG